MKNQSLQNLIQAVGRHTGQAARDLLYQARAEDPSQFVLQLVAAAVACRCSRLQVRNDELDLVLEWDGTPPPAASLVDLYASFETSSRDPRTRYLALGLTGAFATGIAQLQVDVWDGRQGVRLALTPNNQSHQLLKTDPFGGVPLCARVRCLERSKFWALARAVKELTSQSGGPEGAAVRERCCWAGPEIMVDRFAIAEEAAAGRCLAWARLEPTPSRPHLELRTLRPRHGLELQEKPPVPFYALMAFGSESWDWTGLRAVVHGISVPTPVPLAFRDLSVLISAEEIEADVQFNSLRSTPALERVIEILNTVGARMATDLMARPEQIGFDQSEVAARVFEDLSHFYQRQQNQQLALQCLQQSLVLREQVLGATHPDLVDGWSQLLELNRRIGNHSAILPIQERLIPLLRASGENHLRKHRVAEATSLFRRALELEEQLPETPDGLHERYHQLALLVKEHRLPGAEDLFQKAMALRRGQPDASPELELQSLFELADRHRANRRHAEAEVQARRALELAEKLHGDSKALVPYLKLLADILKASNRYGEATDFESRAMMLKFKR